MKTPSTFLYSDHPDIPQFHAQSKVFCENCILGPTSCNALKIIGHMLRGFYIIRRNANKVKIVYCDFHQPTAKEDKKIRKRRTVLKNSDEILPSNTKVICNNAGSQPCSCFYSTSPNILQFEISNDELTRNAMNENGTGPATCEELLHIGYIQDGFYMLRFNLKTIKIVYCKLGEEYRKARMKEKENNQLQTTAAMKINIRKNTLISIKMFII